MWRVHVQSFACARARAHKICRLILAGNEEHDNNNNNEQKNKKQTNKTLCANDFEMSPSVNKQKNNAVFSFLSFSCSFCHDCFTVPPRLRRDHCPARSGRACPTRRDACDATCASPFIMSQTQALHLFMRYEKWVHTSTQQTHTAADSMRTPKPTLNPDQTQKCWAGCAAHQGISDVVSQASSSDFGAAGWWWMPLGFFLKSFQPIKTPPE